MNQRLARFQWIRKRSIYQRVFKEGQRFQEQLFDVWVLSLPRDVFFELNKIESPTFGVVVSRQVNRLATQRNLWKRRILEALKRNRSSFPKNTFVVIRVRKSTKRVAVAYRFIEQELEAVIRKNFI